ncbi:MAG: ATP-binding protein [Chitinophagales bacterium]|nr:ATP-binding protein [Chitinophagales bacterium]MDW8419521.1 ATP-binding protein [Chitinophagales bacterium]
MSPEQKLNKLLLKQIRKKAGGLENIPAELMPLLEAISQSYDHYERDRHLIERSMDLSSKELSEAYEKLSAQAKLLQKTNEELKQFSFAVSHDLKEPLRTIASYIQLIEIRLKDQLTPETSEFMQYAVSGVKHMQQMLEAMLYYAQIDGQMVTTSSVNLNTALSIAISNLRADLEASKANFIYPNDLPTINGHQMQMVSVFQNLLSNSIKFRSTEPLKIELTFRTLHKNYLFSFRDNGIGIPPSERQRVFNLFRRGHSVQQYEGVGMGLSICKKIIENHQGEMWVDEHTTSGCQIHFTLPVNTQ